MVDYIIYGLTDPETSDVGFVGAVGAPAPEKELRVFRRLLTSRRGSERKQAWRSSFAGRGLPGVRVLERLLDSSQAEATRRVRWWVKKLNPPGNETFPKPPRDPLVYGLRDPRTDLFGYVAATVRGLERPKQHCEFLALENDENEAKRVWLQELLEEGYFPEPCVLERVSSRSVLAQTERAWIEKLRNEGHPLTNQSEGGEGFPGYSVSVVTREKMAAAKRGIPRSLEARAKMSASHKARERTPEELEHMSKLGSSWEGKTRSEETRRRMSEAKKRWWAERSEKDKQESTAKISNTLRGRKLSDETKAKMSEAKKGKPKSEETKRRMSEAKRGRKRDPETVAKIAESLRGRKLSEETRAKMAEGQRRRREAEVASE